MFGINQTSTQDSNVLTIFQTTYWGVDLVIIVSQKLSCQLFDIFLKENLISGPECVTALPAIVDTVFATAQYLAKVKYERVH